MVVKQDIYLFKGQVKMERLTMVSNQQSILPSTSGGGAIMRT